MEILHSEQGFSLLVMKMLLLPEIVSKYQGNFCSRRKLHRTLKDYLLKIHVECSCLDLPERYQKFSNRQPFLYNRSKKIGIYCYKFN